MPKYTVTKTVVSQYEIEAEDQETADFAICSEPDDYIVGSKTVSEEWEEDDA